MAKCAMDGAPGVFFKNAGERGIVITGVLHRRDAYR
jgi:hypothetical protein